MLKKKKKGNKKKINDILRLDTNERNPQKWNKTIGGRM